MLTTPILGLTRRYTFDGRILEPVTLVPIVATALFVAIMIVGVRSGLVSYRGDQLNAIYPLLMVLWLCGVGCQAIRLRGAGEALKILALAALVSMTASLATVVLARVSAPLADDALVRLDRALFGGFDWKDGILAFDRHGAMVGILSRVYASIIWQPNLLFVYLCVTARSDRAWRVLAALAIALVICVAVFPFCPAVGGYAHFGIARHDVPNVLVSSAWQYPDMLTRLKDGRLSVLGLDTMQGIVAMPSFHASSAVILAWGFWGSWFLRWPFLILNILMIVSAVPIGGHYIVDVLAGAGTALASVWLVSRRSASAV